MMGSSSRLKKMAEATEDCLWMTGVRLKIELLCR